jgi:hypothetical protein
MGSLSHQSSNNKLGKQYNTLSGLLKESIFNDPNYTMQFLRKLQYKLQYKLTYKFKRAIKSHVQILMDFVNMLINFVNLELGSLCLRLSHDVQNNMLCDQYYILYKLLGKIFTNLDDSKWILDNLEFKLGSQLEMFDQALKPQVKIQLDFVKMLTHFVYAETAFEQSQSCNA